MCVREREREKEMGCVCVREREREREREGGREGVYVRVSIGCVGVCQDVCVCETLITL